MKYSFMLFLSTIALSGCASINSLKPFSGEPKHRPTASESPMSQLGVALPAMKPGDDRELKILAADELSKKGFWAEAVDLYLEAETMQPSKKKLDSQLAAAFAGAGRYRESTERYERLIKLSPKQVSHYNNLGVTLMQAGDFAACERVLREGLKIDSRNETLAINLGLALARQRRFDESIVIMTPFIGESAAHHNVGVIATDINDEASARAFFQKAASLGNTPPLTAQFLVSLQSTQPTATAGY